MTASFSVLQPVAITDAMFISSTAPETDYTAWSAVTTYAAGDRSISTTTHRIYESLVAGNLNHDPTDINNRVGATPYWLDYGPTNKWAMLDAEVSSPTTNASPLTVVIRPGFFNCVGLVGLDAEHLAITVKDAPGGNVIYSYDADLEDSAPGDYYEYFFSGFKPQTDFIVSGIDQYNAAEITLSLTSASAPVACGMLQLGDLFKLRINLRSLLCFQFKLSQTAFIKYSHRCSVINGLLDIPCLWIATDLPQFSGARVFGLGSAEMSYENARNCLLSVDVKGLI